MKNSIKILEDYINYLELKIKENDDKIYDFSIQIEEIERENEIYIQKQIEIVNAIKKSKIQDEISN
jgi:hypothetical protein